MFDLSYSFIHLLNSLVMFSQNKTLHTGNTMKNQVDMSSQTLHMLHWSIRGFCLFATNWCCYVRHWYEALYWTPNITRIYKTQSVSFVVSQRSFWWVQFLSSCLSDHAGETLSVVSARTLNYDNIHSAKWRQRRKGQIRKLHLVFQGQFWIQ